MKKSLNVEKVRKAIWDLRQAFNGDVISIELESSAYSAIEGNILFDQHRLLKRPDGFIKIQIYGIDIKRDKHGSTT